MTKKIYKLNFKQKGYHLKLISIKGRAQHEG